MEANPLLLYLGCLVHRSERAWRKALRWAPLDAYLSTQLHVPFLSECSENLTLPSGFVMTRSIETGLRPNLTPWWRRVSCIRHVRTTKVKRSRKQQE